MSILEQLHEMYQSGTMAEYTAAFKSYCSDTNQSLEQASATLFAVPSQVANTILVVHMVSGDSQ